MFINCPHCDLLLEILELNCGIFRCGVYRTDFVQIPPHSSKEECDRLLRDRLIWGCGKPFQIIEGKVIECDYV